MDDKRITRTIKRHAGMFIALKQSDVMRQLRALLMMYTQTDYDHLIRVCNMDHSDFAAFLYAGGKLSAHQMTSIMSNLNQQGVFQKQETNELGRVGDEKLAQHIRVMQELNILNNMRAQKALDELAEGRENQK